MGVMGVVAGMDDGGFIRGVRLGCFVLAVVQNLTYSVVSHLIEECCSCVAKMCKVQGKLRWE
jgi:hypothetical protein